MELEEVKHLLMLGRHYQRYGSIEQSRLGQVVAAISVGSDPRSPSIAAKGEKNKPNEDGLLVVKRDNRYLLAVADGHFGNSTSHALLERLRDKPFPVNSEVLLETVQAIQRPALMVGSGSTLTAAVYDEETGKGFGVSTGDSTLATIAGGTFQEHTVDNTRYIYFNSPTFPEEWHQFYFQLPPGGLLTLFTDGINECHYRSPATSIQPGHIATLWEQTGGQAELFTELLVKFALEGVGGNPGGQDNIAVIALARSN